jgi:hypothetical protein
VGGVASCAGYRAWSCEARDWCMRVCMGTRHPLCACWAAWSRRSGMVGVTCMVGLRRFWFRESIYWVEAGLAAR